MTAPTDTTIPEDLTERQQEVLRMTREGKTPTEIGTALDIRAQGVHGHLVRLRKRGLLPPLESSGRAGSRRAPRNGTQAAIVTPDAAFAQIRASIDYQRNALRSRAAEIDGEISQLQERLQEQLKSLRAEKKGAEKAIADLDKFEETLPAP